MGTHVLVLGGCGRVGRVLAAGLHAAGHGVTITARDEAEAHARAPEGLPCRIVDFDDPAGSARFARDLPELKIDHAVLSFGARYEDTPLLEFEPGELASLVAGQIAAQWRAVRAAHATIGRRGTVVWINGGSAHTPQIGRSPSNLVAAATWMLQRCLREESEAAERVVSLLLEGAVGAPTLPARVRIEDDALVEACRRLLADPAGISFALAPGAPLRRILPADEAADLEELS